MAKETNESSPKLTSKKHLARLERENRQKKFLLIGIISILVLIVALVVYGILNNSVLKPAKPVAKVGKTTITVEQFTKRVQYERLSNVENFVTYAASPYAMFFQSQLMEIQNSLDDYLQFGSDKLDQMINEAVASEKAKELGITVSDEDINKELERGFGFFPNGTPTPEPTFAYRPTSTFSATQLAIVTLTPTPTDFPTETPLPTETSLPATPTIAITSDGTVTVEPVVPTSVAATSTPTLEPTAEPTATEIPLTPTPYTREGFEGLYKTMVSNIDAQFSYTDADFRDYVRSLLINQKLFDYVNKDVTPDQEMVWARHILVSTEEEANSVLEKLKAGEEFSILAAGFSIDTTNSSNGGDLGWFTKGQMVEPFETEAYKLKIGEISKPIQTDFGYHIIQVLGHEVRQLTESELTNFKSNAFNKYLEDAKAEMNVKKFDIWASVVPNTPAIPEEYRIDPNAQQ